MARNLHPGPDWIPGTIIAVLGPVTYTVETDEGQRWKRHADQIKSWIPPTSREPPLDIPVDISTSEDTILPEPEPPAETGTAELGTAEPTGGTVETAVTPEAETPAPPAEFPETSAPTPRYPTRA